MHSTSHRQGQDCNVPALICILVYSSNCFASPPSLSLSPQLFSAQPASQNWDSSTLSFSPPILHPLPPIGPWPNDREPVWWATASSRGWEEGDESQGLRSPQKDQKNLGESLKTAERLGIKFNVNCLAGWPTRRLFKNLMIDATCFPQKDQICLH